MPALIFSTPAVRLAKGVATLCTVLVLAAAPGYGQEAAAQPPGGKNWVRRHFTFGGRLSVAGNSLLGSDPFVQATSNPARHLSRTNDWTDGRIGGGPTLQVRIWDRLGLAVDLVHRKAGYSFEEELVTGVDLESTTSVNEQKTVTTTEATRVKYWDIPVLARLYFGRRRGEYDFRRFVSTGLTVRRVGGVSTTRNIDGPDDESSSDAIAPRAANRTVLGWVAAAGVQGTDDFGLTLMPEVRYTRWTSDTFTYAPARTSRHQVEFIVGITF